MKKIKKTIIACCFVALPTLASNSYPLYDGSYIHVEITCNHIDKQIGGNTVHRTPPVAPEVYLDNEHSILLFGMPCFESTLQLVIPGTESSVYTYVIPDGDTEVQFPTSLSGEYELHIHRGNYCFNGIIEL